jgi:hypothetical protein
MASHKEYEERMQRFDHGGILRLWDAILAGDVPDWDPGKAFEYLILRAFQLEGAAVVWPYSVRDANNEELEQIDGAVFVRELHGLVEAKDHAAKVDVGPVAKLRSQLLRRPAASIGLAISRSGFSDPAVALVRYMAPQTILLWQGTEIDLALKKQKMVDGLERKYRYAVTHGWPDLNLGSIEEYLK